MGKFNPTTTSGSPSVLDEASVKLPVAPQVEVTTPPPGTGLLDQVLGGTSADLSAPPADVETVPYLSGSVENQIAREEQREREGIQPLAQRFDDKERVDRWKARQNGTTADADDGTGGFFRRANQVKDAFESGEVRLPTKPGPAGFAGFKTGGQQGLIEAEAEANPLGSFALAANKAGAIQNTQTETGNIDTQVDPAYLTVGAAVTENMMAELAFGNNEAEVPGDIRQQAEGEQTVPVSKAQGNQRLGQQIHREYMRRKNAAEGLPVDQYQDLSAQEATTLGDSFKELYAAALGPDMIKRFVGADGQVYFQPTAVGLNALKASATARKRMFPKVNIRPQKTPTSQLRGEQRREVKRVTGKVGTPVGMETLEQAANNLNKIPNVVDTQRMRILFATILPALAGREGLDSVGATINNFGADKMAKFQAQEAAARKEGDTTYSAEENMNALQDSIAQSVRSIAMERGGANYFTYTIQAFNGRMAPQQTFFDATSSKAVRFVTRNATPANITRGSRAEANLLQMYAMMLVKGADALLPAGRRDMLKRNAPKLQAWGRRLEQILDETMSADAANAVADAIAAGMPLTDPNFPKFDGMKFDPEQDAELMQAIKDKGEDGPHFIDGLIDFSHYWDAAQAGRPYHSYFNAYMDGKTNGIASNGIQMGSKEVALATGVIRENTKELLDDGDIRDQLKRDLLYNITENGFDGTIENPAALHDVAKAVYSYRDLNKATTMTFGYGKELASFGKDIAETVSYFEQLAREGGEIQVDDETTVVTVDSSFLTSRDQFTDKKDRINRTKERAVGEELRDYNDRLLVEDWLIASGQGTPSDTVHYDYVDGDGNKIEVKTIKPDDLEKGMAHEIHFKQHMEQAMQSGNAPDFVEIWTQNKFGLKEGDKVSIKRLGRIPFDTYMDNLVDNATTPGPKKRKSDGSLWFTHAVPNIKDLLIPVIKTTDAVKKHGLQTFAQSLDTLRKEFANKENGADAHIVEMLTNKYNESLAGVLSNEAVDSRALMRSAAVLHAVANKLFSIKSYTGFDLNLGGNETLGWDAAEKRAYNMKVGDETRKVQAAHYQTEPTAAAIRRRTDPATGEIKYDVGGDAYGGSLPGPVQSLDAATVAMTVTGDSWKKLAARGNPYIHTIFDAFKVDANGYDVVLEEVNKNWLKASMNWSYLEQTHISTKAMMEEFWREVNAMDPNKKIDISLQGPYRMMGQLLEPDIGEHGPWPKTLKRKLNNLLEKPHKADPEEWNQHVNNVTKKIWKIMEMSGWDYKNPQNTTVSDLKTFMRALTNELELGRRLSKMINHTNKKKAELAKEIRKSGPVYQYYAH